MGFNWVSAKFSAWVSIGYLLSSLPLVFVGLSWVSLRLNNLRFSSQFAALDICGFEFGHLSLKVEDLLLLILASGFGLRIY